jgi:hypothetical protein
VTLAQRLENLRADGSPQSDGVRIAALRHHLVLEKMGLVPPPGYQPSDSNNGIEATSGCASSARSTAMPSSP